MRARRLWVLGTCWVVVFVLGRAIFQDSKDREGGREGANAPTARSSRESVGSEEKPSASGSPSTIWSRPRTLELRSERELAPHEQAFLEAPPQAAAVQMAIVQWMKDRNVSQCFLGHHLVGEIEYLLRFQVKSEVERMVVDKARFVRVESGMSVPETVGDCIEDRLGGEWEFQAPESGRTFLANYLDDFDVKATMHLPQPERPGGRSRSPVP